VAVLAADQVVVVDARERAAAGDALARLGDPRFRADAWYLPDEPILGFVEVPAGAFLMGSDKEHNPAGNAEVPQHSVDLPTYYVARYPVTVAQFRDFVRESRYQIEGLYGRLNGLDNYPVVFVSWHDAVAYCGWLTARLREWSDTPPDLARRLCGAGWEVRLPSEAEWEKAARGMDGRIYPWGDRMEPNGGNYQETYIYHTGTYDSAIGRTIAVQRAGWRQTADYLIYDSTIGRTVAVGCFPGGASPYGCQDMAGNVCEWCHSLYMEYPYQFDDGRESPEGDGLRVVRGGSFVDSSITVRCAFRYKVLPNTRTGNFGFRVVVAPGFPG
jgi:formylglycine-generating enzyme required for sulfatase activity